MSNDVPLPPRVDLDYAMQVVAQLYGSIAAIDQARRQVPEWTSRAEAAEAKLREVEKQFFEKERMLREVTAKLDHAQRQCAEREQHAEQARVELSSVQSSLNAAKAEKAAL